MYICAYAARARGQSCVGRIMSNFIELCRLVTGMRLPKGNSTEAHCIGCVVSPLSKPNRLSSSLRLFCHVPLESDQPHSDWRMRLNLTPGAMGCTYICEHRSMFTYVRLFSHSYVSFHIYALQIQWAVHGGQDPMIV